MYHAKDYWLYIEKPEGKKERTHLVQVLKEAKKDASVVKVVFDRDRFDPEKKREADVPSSGLYLSLGERPRFGTAYGVKVEPYLFSKEIGSWGKVRFFRRLQDIEKQRLEKALDFAYKTLDGFNLIGWMDTLSHVQLKHKAGKWAGMYSYRLRGDAATDVITLGPEDFLSVNNLKYLILHESAHGIWYRLLDEHDRAEWVELYTQYSKLGRVKSKEAIKLLDEWLASGEPIARYAKSLGDEGDEQTKLWAVYDSVLTRANLDTRNLDTLRNTGRSISRYWPDHSVDLTDMDKPIGEYASTKPEEFFAEAFAMFLTGRLHFSEEHGRKMPDNIAALLRKTLKKFYPEFKTMKPKVLARNEKVSEPEPTRVKKKKRKKVKE